MEKKIHWQPQPKQAFALVRDEDEIFFGGARGGGKTDCGMAWLLYDIDKEGYRFLVIRRNSEDLKDWIDRAKHMYVPTKVEITGLPSVLRFPSGAIGRTGHLSDGNAYSKYQGHEYQKILIEEITQITREDDYEKLLGSCRSTVTGIKPQVFATGNPDGPGFKWVKKRWNIPDYPKEPVITEVKDASGKVVRRRIFIPSRLEDNPALLEKDPGYKYYLESIQDEDLRRAWREGCWTGIATKGAYYSKEIERTYNEGRITTVPCDKALPVYTYWDLGMDDATAIGFFQFVNHEIRMIDYYENHGYALDHYVKILQSKDYIYAKNHYFPHDVEVRELSSGKTRKETLESLGINVEVTPNIPVIDGINAARVIFNKIYFDKDKCNGFLDYLSQYSQEWDEKYAVWKDKPKHDWASHAADVIRYMAVNYQESRYNKKDNQTNFNREYFNKFGII